MINTNVDAARDAGIDPLEKIEKLGRPVTLVAFADHEAGSDVEGRKQPGQESGSAAREF